MAAGPNGYVGPAVLVIFALERNDGIRNIVVLSAFALTLGMGMAAATHADWIIADSNDDAEEKPLRGGEMELGSSDLELGIEGTVPDKVQTDGTIITGTIWKFTVPDYLIVGDFDSYTDNDAAGEAIWQHWIDGYDIPDNGAQASYLVPPYAEQTIVHGGAQSMPLFYVNEAGVTNSEAELTLPADRRDWTVEGVSNLSLWFRGEEGNAAEPLYVAVAGTAVINHDDPNAAQLTDWTEWVIPLQSFADQGVVLTNVDRIALGLGTRGNTTASGGSGKMYVDDIRLYRP